MKNNHLVDLQYPPVQIKKTRNGIIRHETIRCGRRRNKKLRLRYSIEYLSDTEISFRVLFIDKTLPSDRFRSNVESSSFRKWEVVNDINSSILGEYSGSEIWHGGIIFISKNNAKRISNFTCKEQRDKCIALAKRVLIDWATNAFSK